MVPITVPQIAIDIKRGRALLVDEFATICHSSRSNVERPSTLGRGTKVMREIWLRTNRRAILFGCIPPLLLTLAGAWIVCAAMRTGGSTWLGGLVIALGVAGVGLLMTQLFRPRIVFADGNVLFYVRSGKPITVPVNVVEAFFAGQGPAHLPAVSKQPQTVNLVARLSQRHTEWTRQEVKRALGNWADGYITIRGTWCEPLNGEVIRRLNRRLKEVKDEIEASSHR
jgi:hypothetical protein